MCFDERKTPVNIIFLMSILVVICAIIMVVFTVMATTNDTMDNLKEVKSFDDINGMASIFAIFFFGLAVFILIQAILGFCFKCCKHPCYAWCYGILSFPVWLLLLVFGGLAVGVALAGEDEMVKVCEKILNEAT